MSRKRNHYSEEYKVEAVGLAEKVGFVQAGKDLGVNESLIRRWAKTNKGGIITSSSKGYAELEAEIRRLRKENSYLKQINEVFLLHI